jgi:hypothetical protein
MIRLRGLSSTPRQHAAAATELWQRHSIDQISSLAVACFIMLIIFHPNGYLLSIHMSTSSSGQSSCSSPQSEDDGSFDSPSSCHLPANARKGRRRSGVKSRPLKENAPWHIMLSHAGQGTNSVSDEHSVDGRYFRRRFRLPYALFEALIQVMLDDNWFPSEYEANGRGKLDSCGVRGCSLQVKFLSVLRVLGRGVCFDELYDGSNCSESMMSRFFHAFLQTFNDRLFYCVVNAPKTKEDVSKLAKIYEFLGMVGAIGYVLFLHYPFIKSPMQVY